MADDVTDVQCITCARWSQQRAAPDMAKQGFGHCERREPFIANGGERLRDCPHHAGAKPEDIQARRAFIKKHEQEARR